MPNFVFMVGHRSLQAGFAQDLEEQSLSNSAHFWQKEQLALLWGLRSGWREPIPFVGFCGIGERRLQLIWWNFMSILEGQNTCSYQPSAAVLP